MSICGTVPRCLFAGVYARQAAPRGGAQSAAAPTLPQAAAPSVPLQPEPQPQVGSAAGRTGAAAADARGLGQAVAEIDDISAPTLVSDVGNCEQFMRCYN